MCAIRDSPLAELASVAPVRASPPTIDISVDPLDPFEPNPTSSADLDPAAAGTNATKPIDPTTPYPVDPTTNVPRGPDPTTGDALTTNPFTTTAPGTSVSSVTLVGISKDRPEKLHEWAQKLKLPPGMVFLSDPGGRIGKEYGVHSALLGLATTRKTVIVDNGVVKDSYVANVGVKSHAGWVEKHLNTV
ncbi:hypothetical protein A1Q1_00474 [Trichosporon asahii var. asahii CBS 2479]|uniref:Alkyl hydroperoxide reductase subunit C/ Thiol specific antioxidant domain-containing protein n=1 Tax=Trichosporon asahii var. asahii (strain ATCC 90039 / CBS 2479 / JCM 2466 / KCTC 7840 / NBRC 103889/ NCYC 2677 / UAMH 7654) TaxID=1186058 RepID=J5RJD3_TRIAS|nr:hypothetical protein A1Q1_00474 [Trichosporon asahii var. asahii CBS 2479]EJT52963.1 hypothetical protein A1Q1_00474 [Trichosporon asahii var. asahii CBS 2479]